LDRFIARATLDSWWLFLLFSQIDLNPSYLTSRFNKPPFSSRTVGFPESGWRPWHFTIQSSCRVHRVKCLFTCPHSSLSLLHASIYPSLLSHLKLCVFMVPRDINPPCAESSFTIEKVLPLEGMTQRFSHSPLALPSVYRYYELMRQTY
jgi:hypothetical protein